MKIFQSRDEAKAWADANQNHGIQFTPPETGGVPAWCVWETEAERDARLPPPPTATPPRWITVGALVDRMSAILPSMLSFIGGNSELQALQMRLLAGDPENPGYLNLNSNQLRAGFETLIEQGADRVGLTPELLEQLLS